jgi:glutamate synthase (NADPH/NADH) small chain
MEISTVKQTTIHNCSEAMSNPTNEGMATSYHSKFTEMNPPLDTHSALVESDRCYFCFDAPCTKACPTDIDVPNFIRMISSHNPLGAAKTILKENIMGGTCARACPVETLCEQSCVRNQDGDKPIQIGLLQRYATDIAMEAGETFFTCEPDSGHSIGIVGGGPGGLSCAHRLAMLGHQVVIYEARDKTGGLNEYGLAAYKMMDNFAQREVDYITAIGNIDIRHGMRLGDNISLAEIRAAHDAVFLALGLGACNSIGLTGEDSKGAENAVDYIRQLRQSEDLSKLSVGSRVVVIGGGMTAIDMAAQIRFLGAHEVTIVYRRGAEHMKASVLEQEFAQTNEVRIMHWAQPVQILVDQNQVVGVEFKSTNSAAEIRENFVLQADMVFKAIGQSLESIDGGSGIEFELQSGRLRVDAERRTSKSGIWAGGDCVSEGDDLTVSAVQDGKLAAQSIHNFLNGTRD